MGDVKPWHVVVMVLGLLGLGIGGFVTMRNSGPVVTLSKTMIVADVVTGDLYELTLPEHGVMIPAKNPKTGTPTMFPVEQKENGAWVIVPRYRGGLTAANAPKPVAVKDVRSGEVAVVGQKPEPLTMPK